MFAKSLEHKALDKILKSVDKKHDHIWIVRTAGLGEAQLLSFMMDELFAKWNAKNPCLVSHRKIYKELFGMYTDIPFYSLNIAHNNYAAYLNRRDIKYKNKYFHIHHCTIYESLDWLKKHQQGDTSHTIDSIKEWAGVSKFKQVYPEFSEETMQAALEKIKSIDLDINKFVFIVSEANGTEKLPEEIWKKVTEDLNKKGYDVFVNTQNGKTNFGKSVALNIAEAAYIASLASGIIALRCGFTEILAALKSRKSLYTLYTPFRSIDGENFIKTYTLKEYPFVNQDTIFEYPVNRDNMWAIVNHIVEEF